MQSVVQLNREWKHVSRIIEAYAPRIKPGRTTPKSEFQRRVKAVQQALAGAGCPVGLVFSDEHYCGDVPYLGGNTNVSVEQVAGVIGPTGFHIVAGLEGGYVAEQLAPRAGAVVHKAELLQLADEKYPIRAERLEEIIEAAAGQPLTKVKKIALLTPRQVVPAAIVEYLNHLFGAKNVLDLQLAYQKVKYEKSDVEMALTRDAGVVADAMMRAMLAVLRPGMLETEVTAWAYLVGQKLGCESNGFQVMCGTGDSCRTLIGPPLNKAIRAGDWVHLGVAPTRDGLNACIRRSVIAVDKPAQVKPRDRYWFEFIEAAYRVGLDAYVNCARTNCPARTQEQALVEFFRSRSDEVSARVGRRIELETLKPYTGTHNSGYTECQEFFGAITLDSHEPLGRQIVTMLDVALRGFGDHWNDVIIPGLDYVLIENTLGKRGRRVETLTRLPLNVQGLVGNSRGVGVS
jgi:Xaa-Pro aminopeptidase